MEEKKEANKIINKYDHLPKRWYFILALVFIIGLSLIYFNPKAPILLNKITKLIHPDKWSQLLGIFLIFIVVSHLIVYGVLEITKRLFSLEGKHERKNLWPPALLGVFESIMYPTALLYGEGKFISFWIIIKVAGNWPRWGLKTDHINNIGINILEVLQEGRRRYYQFLIGSALMILLSVIVYGIIKIMVFL